MDLTVFFYTFLAVFVLNLIPFFGPPTWMALSFIAFSYPIASIPLFILIALAASTTGRFVLTISSKLIIRNRFLSARSIKNIDYLKTYLEKSPATTFNIFLIEAFTPLPSHQFFIAYGLTGLKARYALIPFAIGRTFTYSFWVLTATELSKRVAADSFSNLSFFSTSFILIELVLIFMIYLFIKIDWQHVLLHKKIRLLN